MKKISLLILIFISMFLFKKKKKKTNYIVGEERAFIDKIYEYIEKKPKDYCLVDVRDLNEAYGMGHFRGFINYDIQNGNTDEFIYKIESMYSKDKTIFIIDEDGSYVETLQSVLNTRGYKKVIIYLGGYERLKDENKNDFEIVSGIDDCGC